jgi:predicted nucleic acid-binding protein
MVNIPLVAVIDTGFWYAICDENDNYHNMAVSKNLNLESYKIILPWPCLYETVNTQFVKHPFVVEKFEKLIKRPGIIFLDDSKYREDAYTQVVQMAVSKKRHISLVDMVIRFILEDVNNKVHFLITFNGRDFHDVCRKRQIQIL